MKKNGITLSIVLSIILVVLNVSLIEAQERTRRINPAFPIGAGEKMIHYFGNEINGSNQWQTSNNAWTRSSAGTGSRVIKLPVGTTLKRILGDFVDADANAGKNITIELARARVDDETNVIVLRSFSTSGISSSNQDDFKQVVANPLSHSMLQGWTYFIRITFPDGIAFGDLKVGNVKIIYEP